MEVVSDAGSLIMDLQLPEAIADHCMLTLDLRGPNEQVLIIGGRTLEGTTYKTHILGGNKWEKGPDLIYARQEHACAVIKSATFDNQGISMY